MKSPEETLRKNKGWQNFVGDSIPAEPFAAGLRHLDAQSLETRLRKAKTQAEKVALVEVELDKLQLRGHRVGHDEGYANGRDDVERQMVSGFVAECQRTALLTMGPLITMHVAQAKAICNCLKKAGY